MHPTAVEPTAGVREARRQPAFLTEIDLATRVEVTRDGRLGAALAIPGVTRKAVEPAHGDGDTVERHVVAPPIVEACEERPERVAIATAQIEVRRPGRRRLGDAPRDTARSDRLEQRRGERRLDRLAVPRELVAVGAPDCGEELPSAGHAHGIECEPRILGRRDRCRVRDEVACDCPGLEIREVHRRHPARWSSRKRVAQERGESSRGVFLGDGAERNVLVDRRCACASTGGQFVERSERTVARDTADLVVGHLAGRDERGIGFVAVGLGRAAERREEVRDVFDVIGARRPVVEQRRHGDAWLQVVRCIDPPSDPAGLRPRADLVETRYVRTGKRRRERRIGRRVTPDAVELRREHLAANDGVGERGRTANRQREHRDAGSGLPHGADAHRHVAGRLDGVDDVRRVADRELVGQHATRLGVGLGARHDRPLCSIETRPPVISAPIAARRTVPASKTTSKRATNGPAARRGSSVCPGSSVNASVGSNRLTV